MTITTRNKANPYFAKQNHVRLSRTAETKATLDDGGSGGGTTASSISTNGGAITFLFNTAYPVIQYADDVWAVQGATVTSMTPVSQQLSGVHSDIGTYTNLWRHGAMSSAVALGNQGGTGANPASTLQGWDEHQSSSPTTTEVEYSHAINVDPGKAALPLSGVQIIAKSKSNLVPADDARDNLLDMGLLYNVATLPAAGSFRMWNPNDVPTFNVSDMDLSVLPLVALPSGAVFPTLTAINATLGPINLFMRQQLFMRGVNPLNQQSQYGGDIANDIATAMHFVCCSAASASDRLAVTKLLVAHGILIAYANESGCRWSSATFSFGGAHQWMKALVVFAARVMRTAANVPARTLLAKWADQAQQRVFGDDLMIYQIARENIETVGAGTITSRPAPVGYRSSMENSTDWDSKPSGDQGSYMYEMAYRGTNASQWMSLALIMRQIGAETMWGNPQFFDYVDRYYNWWVTRAKQSDGYLRALNKLFVDDYFQPNSPAYAATGVPPANVRLVVRDSEIWVECSENLDMRFAPDFSAFSVIKNGSAVTFANNTTTATGALSTGSTNVQFPTITVASATGAAVGKRLISANLTTDTTITSVAGSALGISSRVAALFSAQSITIVPTSIYGRSCAIVLSTPAIAGDVFTLAYTVPGSNFIRNLRGVALPAFTATAVVNKTGELPAAAPARELAYSGPVQATRQYMAASSPASEVIKRLQISARFWLESKNINDTIISNNTGSTTAFRMYFATTADIRIFIAGQQFRMPGAGTALPLNTEITCHVVFDFTATTYATIYRAVFRWNGGEHVASVTGSTGLLDGLFQPNIATIFSTGGTGIVFGAIGEGSSAFDGAIGALAMRWGGAGLSQPADFSAAVFAFGGDWGGNAENLHGVAPQRFYSMTIAEANSKVINRGNGGAAAMTPRRLDATGDDLLTYYVLAT